MSTQSKPLNDDRPKRRFLRATVATTLVAAVVGGLAVVGGATEPYGSTLSEAAPPLLVTVEPVDHLEQYEVVHEFVGIVEARRESPVGFELGGEVQAVLFDEGDFIEAGSVIAKLDTSILEAERSMLLAARDQARAAVELAAVTRERVAGALAKNAVSAQRWDEADKEYQAQLATLERAKAAITTIDARIAKAELRSPFPALVAERFVDEGQVLAAGSPVFHLLESVAPEVRIGVSGNAIDALSAGQDHTLRVRDRDVAAKVKSVLPVRGNGTRSVDVILTLNTRFNGIRRGDLATLEIARAKTGQGFWLPLTALTESSRGLWACYVSDDLADGDPVSSATHRLSRRELEVLHHAGDRVYVRGTLQDGEHVVTEGLQRLVPGQLVRLAPDSAFSTRRMDP